MHNVRIRAVEIKRVRLLLQYARHDVGECVRGILVIRLPDTRIPFGIARTPRHMAVAPSAIAACAFTRDAGAVPKLFILVNIFLGIPEAVLVVLRKTRTEANCLRNHQGRRREALRMVDRVGNGTRLSRREVSGDLRRNGRAIADVDILGLARPFSSQPRELLAVDERDGLALRVEVVDARNRRVGVRERQPPFPPQRRRKFADHEVVGTKRDIETVGDVPPQLLSLTFPYSKQKSVCQYCRRTHKRHDVISDDKPPCAASRHRYPQDPHSVGRCRIRKGTVCRHAHAAVSEQLD